MAYNNKQYTKEQIEEAVKNANCFSGVFRNLGIKVNGGSYRWIKKLIKKFNIETIHFQTKNENLLKAGLAATLKVKEKKYKCKDLSRNERLRAKELRTFMEFWGIEEKCVKCQISEWKGVPLRLDIDHINQNPLDNRIENLQFLCPNCHRIKTIDKENGSKINKKSKRKSLCHCGKEKHRASKECKQCSWKTKQKAPPISKEEMSELVAKYSLSQIGRKFSISDTYVRKLCLVFGIDYHTRRKEVLVAGHDPA